MDKDMQGKVALVTGGYVGIGRAVVQAFSRRGASVVVTDINAETGKQAVSDLEKGGCDCLFVHADASKPEDNERSVREGIKRFGRLDFAVNNAGIGGESNPTGGYSVEGWRKVIDVNLNGVFFGMRYEIPAMLESGGGAIVNMASILGLVGFANAPAYVAAKHGVVGLTKTAAMEYATQNLRVNAIAPGFIETPLIESSGMARGTDLYNSIAGLHPMKRLGLPDEVAEAAVWLCSEAASFVTGTVLRVDGGYVSQ